MVISSKEDKVTGPYWRHDEDFSNTVMSCGKIVLYCGNIVRFFVSFSFFNTVARFSVNGAGPSG